VESLFGAVVDAGDAGQGEQAGQPEGYLVVEFGRIPRRLMADALLHVVIVQERDEEPGRIPVRTDNIGFDCLALAVQPDHGRRRGKTPYHGLEDRKKRVIKSSVHPDCLLISHVEGAPPDKPGDVVLSGIIEHFTEGEEVAFADRFGEFAYRVAEQAGQVAFQVPQGIDAETVDVEAGDDVLVGGDQRVLDTGVVGAHLAERREIPDGVVAACLRVALPPEVLVVLQLAGATPGHRRRSR